MSQRLTHLSILPKRDGRNPMHYLYHNPSCNAQKYARIANEIYRNRMLCAAEDVARSCGKLLVPTSCLHWEFRGKVADRRVRLGREVYYVLAQDEIPPQSFEKYLDYIAEVEAAARRRRGEG